MDKTQTVETLKGLHLSQACMQLAPEDTGAAPPVPVGYRGGRSSLCVRVCASVRTGVGVGAHSENSSLDDTVPVK